MYKLFLVFAALCAGCADGSLSDAHQADDSFVPTCDIVIDQTIPSAGATHVYHRGNIEFHLSEADPEAIVVADFDGITSYRDDGATIVFTPTEPLTPMSRYTVGLDFCGGQPRIDFSTSALGRPMTVPLDDFVGRTYAIDVTQGRFIAGEALAELAASVFTRQILLSVVDVDEDTDEVYLRIALARPEGDLQDTCSVTLELPPANFAYSPFMNFQASDVDFKAEGSVIHLDNVELSGTLAPDASFVGGGHFLATLNAEDIVDVWGLSDTDTLCSLAANIGVPCHACPSGSGDTCVTIEADDISAPQIEELVVEPITESDTHPDCVDD